MKLFTREQAHKDRGHWHFDWTVKSQDVTWINGTLREESCAAICDVAHKIIEENYYVYKHPGLIAQNPMWARNSNLKYAHGFEHPEFIKSQEDNIEPFIGSRYDVHRSFLISLNPKDFPELQAVIDEHIADNDWIDLSTSIDTRVLVQMPGQITLSHIDAIHKDYDKRADRFEDPGVGDKYWCALSERVPGQYLQWGNTLIADWKPGQTFQWPWGMPHWTCNFSSKPRISMTVRLKGK